MIDDPDKTQNLIAEMDAHLPLTARLSQSLKGMIRRQVASIIPPEQCQVVEVFYIGDEGASHAVSNSTDRTPMIRLSSPSPISTSTGDAPYTAK
jgi:hypothetical protein